MLFIRHSFYPVFSLSGILFIRISFAGPRLLRYAAIFLSFPGTGFTQEICRFSFTASAIEASGA